MLRSLKAFGVLGLIGGVNSYINQAAETFDIADYTTPRPWPSPVNLLRCNDSSCAYAFASWTLW